jgi:hypothetical protein
VIPDAPACTRRTAGSISRLPDAFAKLSTRYGQPLSEAIGVIRTLRGARCLPAPLAPGGALCGTSRSAL